MTTLFVSGIDTEVGKTQVCGALAKALLGRGLPVFTQKWVETGCPPENYPIGNKNMSADLLEHQRIAGQQFNTADATEHAPYCFEFAASPHLAAELERKEVDAEYLIAMTRRLEVQCQHLLIEGAGGLCVPLNNDLLIADLVAKMRLPVVLVTSGRLGSINHTLLSLEYCRSHGIEVRAIVYNHFPNSNEEITNSSRIYMQKFASREFPNTLFLDMPIDAAEIQFSDQQMEIFLR